MLQFRLAKELRGDRTVVEVWNGTVMVATIYPHEDAVAVVSKYFKGVETDLKPPPKITVRLAISDVCTSQDEGEQIE